MQLSAVIIARNEEESIESTMATLAFCDEIVLVDDGSSDKTTALAKKHNATVISNTQRGDFSHMRNLGMERAAGEWILFVDADEVIPPALRKEIEEVTKSRENTKTDKSTPHFVYKIKRRDVFWEKELRYGELSSATNKGYIRLVRKNSGSWFGKVHETFIPSDQITVGTLSNHLIHRSHQGVADFLYKINDYSSIRAKELFDAGAQFSLLSLIFYPPLKFLYTYIVKFGFRDGTEGFIYSFMMSFHSFLVRAKLFQLRSLS